MTEKIHAAPPSHRRVFEPQHRSFQSKAGVTNEDYPQQKNLLTKLDQATTQKVE